MIGLEIKIIVLIVLIGLSGLFSGIETALFSLNNLRVKHLQKKKVRGADTVHELKDNPHRLLTTILICNNVVNIGASALATSIAFGFSLNYAVGITTGVMTLLILIFGEITPKTIATKYNEQISLMIAKPLQLLQLVLLPVVIIFEGLTHTLTTRILGKKKEPLVTEEEIKTFVTVAEEIGQIRESERDMIHRIFKFDDLSSEEVMTPRNKMVCVSIESKIKDVAKLFSKKGHSRMPVYKENLDSIHGFAHILDVQRALLNKKKKNKKVSTIMRPILFVPSTKKLDSLLRFLQRKKNQMAMVVNETGTNIGLVTVEDVVEEIVGEIISETEKIEPLIRKISKNRYSIEGRADVDEIRTRCKINLPAKDAPYSISSHILHKIGRIPEPGEVIKFPEYNIQIKKVDNNTISKVIITQKKKKNDKKR